MTGSPALRVVVVQPDGWTGTSGPARLLASLLDGHPGISLSQMVTVDAVESATFTSQGRTGLAGLVDRVLLRSPSPIPAMSFHATTEMVDFLDRTDPDVCLVHPGDLYSLGLVRWMREVREIPVVTHTMDDHYNTWPNAAGRSRFIRRALKLALQSRYRSRLADLYEGAAANFTISEKMATEYSHQFSLPFSSLRPPAKTASLGTNTDSVDRDSPSIVYAGSLRPGVNAGAIELFAKALDAGELHLYSFDEVPPTVDNSNVHSHMGLPQEELNVALGTYDFGLIALDDTPENSAFVRLSWPSKLSDYLALGLTPIYVGPPCEAAEVIDAFDLGIVVTDTAQLSSALSTLGNGSLRAAKAKEFADANLSLGSARAEIVRALRAAASPKSNSTVQA